MPDLHAIGRAALAEITSVESVGADAGQKDEGDGIVSVYFENNLTGYPGWHWTVSISTLEGEEPSVLETELTPAEGALLAPDWVPWSDRLADYKAAQEALGEAAPDDDESDAAGDDDSDDDTDDDSDEDDTDDLGSDVVHGGDVDGVDIDEVDDSQADADDDEADDEADADADPDDEGEKTY